MENVLEGNLDGNGLRIAIVTSRFNAFITKELLAGARDALRRHGVRDQDVTVVWVPGSFELPQGAALVAQAERHEAIVCLGVVVRGATAHFEYVAGECARGIARVASQTGIPCAFGVLTTDTVEQAIERAGTKAGNKGFDAACTAIEMANLRKRLGSRD